MDANELVMGALDSVIREGRLDLKDEMKKAPEGSHRVVFAEAIAQKIFKRLATDDFILQLAVVLVEKKKIDIKPLTFAIREELEQYIVKRLMQ